jgi:hypothetical protein
MVGGVPVPHKALTTFLTIEMGPIDPTKPVLTGGVLRPRYINALIGRNVTTGFIDDCPGASVQLQSFKCVDQMPVTDPTGFTNCQTRFSQLVGNNPDCTVDYYVGGFQANGIPECKCAVNCPGPGPSPPPTPTPGGADGSWADGGPSN